MSNTSRDHHVKSEQAHAMVAMPDDADDAATRTSARALALPPCEGPNPNRAVSSTTPLFLAFLATCFALERVEVTMVGQAVGVARC